MRFDSFLGQFPNSLGWQVVYLDWQHYAPASLGPDIAASRGRGIGRSLGWWMTEIGCFPTQVHAIGHSAGSWLADSFIETAIDYPSSGGGTGASAASSQLTLLDAYETLVYEQVELGRIDVPTEHYFDDNDRIALLTSTIYANGVNIDVSALPTDCLISRDGQPCSAWFHAHPVRWYTNKIPPPGLVPPEGEGQHSCFRRSVRAGFERSPVFRDFLALQGPGYGCTPMPLTAGARYCTDSSNFVTSSCSARVVRVPNASFDPARITPGPTGTVSPLTPNRVRMLTGSPVEFTTTQDFGSPVQLFSVDINVIRGETGSLKIYQASSLLAEVSLAEIGSNTAGEFATLALLPVLEGTGSGTHNFRFLLETTDANGAEIELRNLDFFAINASSCDPLDFNQNSLFPEDQDLIDFLSILAGGPCSPGNSCNDIDFDNDGLFPSEDDLVAFLRVLAGGTCN